MDNSVNGRELRKVKLKVAVLMGIGALVIGVFGWHRNACGAVPPPDDNMQVYNVAETQFAWTGQDIVFTLCQPEGVQPWLTNPTFYYEFRARHWETNTVALEESGIQADTYVWTSLKVGHYVFEVRSSWEDKGVRMY